LTAEKYFSKSTLVAVVRSTQALGARKRMTPVPFNSPLPYNVLMEQFVPYSGHQAASIIGTNNEIRMSML
jgi:hypothetical protein